MQDNSSRISKLLRDARASVREAERPETPADLSRALTSRSSSRGVFRRLANPQTATLESVSSSGSFSAVPPGGTPPNQNGDLLKKLAASDDPAVVGPNLALLGTELAKGGGSAPSFTVSRAALGSSTSSNDTNACDEKTAGIIYTKLQIKDAKVQCHAAELLLRHAKSAGYKAAALDAMHSLAKRGQAEALREGQIFDPLLQILNSEIDLSVLTSASGVLRYASGESGLQKHLITLGALPALKNAWSRFNDEASGYEPSATTQGCTYLATALRNFSVSYSHHVAKLAIIETIFPHGLTRFATHADVIGSMARVLGKIAFDEQCIGQLKECYGLSSSILFAAAAHSTNRLILSRLSLTVGHLLHHDVDGSIMQELESIGGSEVAKVLLALVSSVDVSADTNEESLVNIARLISNLCTSEVLGAAVAAEDDILNWIFGAVRDISTSEDLTLHALMCLSNVSYYLSDDTVQDATIEKLGDVLQTQLFTNNVEGMVEATRILGNMSKLAKGKAHIEATRTDEICSLLLVHEDDRIVFNCLGVFLNLAASGPCALLLDEEKGPHLLTSVESCTTLEVEEIVDLARHVVHNFSATHPGSE